MTRLFFATFFLSLLACYGTGSPKPSDTGFDSSFDSNPSSDSGPPDTDGRDSNLPDSDSTTGDSSDSATGDSSDSGETDPPEVHFWELSNPCPNATYPYALYFEDSSNGWVGCGDGGGLWATHDAGDNFEDGHPNTWTQELYVFNISADPLGGILVCGHDYGNDTLLYRYRDNVWDDLLHYGSNNVDSSNVQMSNCGVAAAAGDGSLMMASLTSGDMSYSSDDGLSWSAEDRYWEDENLDSGGYSYYYMLNLLSVGGQYYGAGSDITSPPVFLGPSQHADGTWHNFHATVMDSNSIGEIWGLATPDGGLTWLAGGRDERYSSVASGFMFMSTDAGLSWAYTHLGGDLDVVQDIAFSEDGLHGIAVGHRYPTSHGGYMLVTEDGGYTWTERTESVPLLYVAAASGGSFWVSGDTFIARGAF